MKRKQLIYAGAALALGIGAYLLLFKKPAPAPEPAPLPPPPDGGPLLPPSSTPAPAPAPQVLTIGDKVKTTVKAFMYDKNTFSVYRAGGTDNKGAIAAGYFAGNIIGFKKGPQTGTNYAVLLGYAYAPKNTAGQNVNEYMIPTNQLTIL
jgi:hypothetical protein